MTYPGKRALDLVIAAPLALATAPVQLVVAAAVWARMGRPVLFRQERPGLGGKPFQMIKFRTMATPDPRRGLVSDEQRLTALGSFLRSTSLDELPTLWNVLRGDMSIVGPRPLLMQYLDRYTTTQARRHEVRPGLTGLAQVNGRNALTWEEKFAYDVEYVDSVSVLADMKILLATFTKVASRDGISAPESVTMPEFTGVERQ